MAGEKKVPDNENPISLKDSIGSAIKEIRGMFMPSGKEPIPGKMGMTNDKAREDITNLGIGRVRSPLMEGMYQTAKTVGETAIKGATQGASLLNYGLAGASDLALGTKFLPGANQAVKQSFGINEPAPPEKWKPVGALSPKPPETAVPVAQQPNAAPVAGGITPAAQPVAPIAEADKSEPLKRWVDKDGVINITGKNLGIKKPEAKTPASTGDIEKDIGARINRLSTDPTNRTRDGGLRTSVQNEIGDLQKALLTAKVENFKTKEVAETNRISREGIAESKKEALATKKDQMFINELKTYATKRQNIKTGETDLDYTPYLFKVAMTAPSRIPDEFKADADAIVKRFDDEVVTRWENDPKSGKAGKKATPKERMGLYDLYLKKLSE